MKVQFTAEQIEQSTAFKKQVEKRVKEIKDENRAEFKVSTKKHYKIWFSKDPNIFLPFINQMRLAMMTKNVKPGTEIRFVYSGDLLSEQAKRDMQEFCVKYEIIPVDFDTIETKEGSDEKIKELVKLELEKATENKGGDLAAASDLARIMIALAEACGIYSDFDFIFTDKMKTIEDIVTLHAPIALNYEFTAEEGENGSNHIIVPTTIKGEGIKLTGSCKKCFKAAQEASIKILKQPLILSFFKTPSGDSREVFLTNIASALLRPTLLEFLKRNNEDQSIYNFRSFIKNFDYKILLSVLHQGNQKQYEKIQNMSEEDAFKMFAMWIIMPGNIEKIDNRTDISTIVSSGLFYVIKNGGTLNEDFKIKIENGEQKIDISQQQLAKKILEHRFDVARIYMRAIKDSIYTSTVTCITGPELHCNLLTQQYIKPKDTQKGKDKFMEDVSLKVLHNLDKIFTHEHFKDGDIQERFVRSINSAKSFSEAILPIFELNPCNTDCYWTEEGKRNMDEYFTEIENAATKIQKCWRESPKSWRKLVLEQTSTDIKI